MREPSLHRLFFAIRPPAGVATHIGELRDAVQLRGSPVGDERLHVTIFLFDDYPALPAGLAERAIAAVSEVAAAPFRILFDTLVSSREPTLLVSREPPPALITFQQRLAAALADAGLAPRRGWSFRPHVTLLYNNRRELGETWADPITWLVEEFVLVHSHVGEGRHVTLARWPLTGVRGA